MGYELNVDNVGDGWTGQRLSDLVEGTHGTRKYGLTQHSSSWQLKDTFTSLDKETSFQSRRVINGTLNI